MNRNRNRNPTATQNSAGKKAPTQQVKRRRSSVLKVRHLSIHIQWTKLPVIGITNAGILSLSQVHSLEGLELSSPRSTTMITSRALKCLSGLPLLCRISIVCSLELICDETFNHLNSLKALRHLELGEHIAPHNARDQPDALLGRMQQLPLLESSLETLHLWLSTVTLEDLRHISSLTNLAWP